MTQEILNHNDMIYKFCPVINNKCTGAYCQSFKAEEVKVKSTSPQNFGDWIPLKHTERRGVCCNPNVFTSQIN